jgi:hypothetical protein
LGPPGLWEAGPGSCPEKKKEPEKKKRKKEKEKKEKRRKKMSTPCPKLTFMHALATSMFTMVLTVALVYTYLFTIVNMDPEFGKLRFWALFRMLGMDIAPDGFGSEE